MAYVSQQLKAELAPNIKSILKKYGLNGSLSVYHHMSLVLTIRSGKIDFIGNAKRINPKSNIDNYIDVNQYHYDEHFDGIAKECISELIPAMNIGNHDNSDIISEFFDVGWYIDINIGTWDKPYQLVN